MAPRCHTAAVANGVFFSPQWQKLTFPETLRANQPSSSPQPENSKWRLKTTIQQLPFSRKTFLQQQERGKHKLSAHGQQQCSVRLHGPLQRLPYLHAIGSSHTPPQMANMSARCRAPEYRAHSLTLRLQLEIRKAFWDSCPVFHMLLIH